MSRSEARTVPNLLVAPPANAQEARGDGRNEGSEFERGYYADGAYTAIPVTVAPTNGAVDPSFLDDGEEPDDQDPQELYYTNLLARYKHLRSLLNNAHETHPMTVTTPSLEDQAETLHNARHGQWRHTFLHTTPTSRFLAAMPQETVIRGLARIESLLTSRNLLGQQGRNLGAWCWGLLTRCRDVGEMGSEEVSVLRELGKRVVRLGGKIRCRGQDVEGRQMVVDDEEVGDSEGEKEVEDGGDNQDGKWELSEDIIPGKPLPDTDDAVPGSGETQTDVPVTSKSTGNGVDDDSLAQAKEALLIQISTTELSPLQRNVEGEQEDDQRREVELNALAMLDMVVTIIGELYGQRDLLDQREVWGE